MPLLNSSIFLSCHELSVGYQIHGETALLASEINVSIKTGEFICVLGKNGSGKSTFLRTLAGLHNPLGGHIVVDADKLIDIPRALLAKKIALVLSDNISTGNISAYEVLSLGRYPYLGWFAFLSNKDKRIINDAIELTGIGNIINKNIFELSDGEKQKIMIARALIQDTPLIILDEPTSHLDISSRMEIMSLLKLMVRETGKSILLASHDLELSMQTADQMWLMGEHRTIQSGVAEDLVFDGRLDKAFNKPGLQFCMTNGEFTFVESQKKQSIGLSGSDVNYFWTKKALLREGFKVEKNADFFIEVSGENKRSWMVNKKGEINKFCSIEELLLYLKV